MPHASVETRNSFPTAAGLASSASGFAALVFALDRALGTGLERQELARLARRCSGSAARSLYGGYVELGFEPGRRETFTRQLRRPEEWPLRVVIAITDTTEKEVGSSAGMVRTATTSPYYCSWIETSKEDLAAARSAIAERDFERLAEVSEHSCLKMHAVMLASSPGLLYWGGATVECLHRVRALRRSGVPVFFTVDAGPQVKAVCTPEAEPRVVEDLTAVVGVQSILSTGLGDGARPAEE
jgi:diphosphomevalonate decarboxylase